MTPYYDDGVCTIYHDDCREILPQLDSVDLVLTDPPYGIGLDYGPTFEDTPAHLDDLIRDVFSLVVAAAPTAMLTPGIPNVFRYPPPTWIVAWVFHQGGRVPWGFNAWQPVLCYGGDPYLRAGRGGRPDLVLKTTGGGAVVKQLLELDHPCPKPLAGWKHVLMRGSVNEGDVVLDPFMGAGTTLRAAKDLGRRAIGVEIEERYCEIAAKRLAQEVLDLGGVA